MQNVAVVRRTFWTNTVLSQKQVKGHQEEKCSQYDKSTFGADLIPWHIVIVCALTDGKGR